ncbi:MAG TPA: RDD family protein [Thermoleophilaceae bacterium]|nr:RDD family protein [Thermoleophilaceae bacterium]
MTLAHDAGVPGPLARPRSLAEPQVVREDVDYAGLVTRTIAFAIDAAIVNLVALVVAAVVALVVSLFPISDGARDVMVVVGGAAFVVWTLAYFTVFWTTTGETPGNRLMRLRVQRVDGSALRPRHALLRLIGMLISFPLLWGYLPILVNERRRGVHDALAGTVVTVTSAPQPR